MAIELEPGLRGEASAVVDEGRTAVALRSGDVPVLGTPAVLALAEEAAVAALRGRLEPDETSVGAWVELEHLRPTPVGTEVTARATLVSVDGRVLGFEFEVSDPRGSVARGRHRRAVVERERFLGGLPGAG